MNFNPDDPKWTAYVLGELDEAEREELEKEIASSAAIREAVEEIRLMTTLVKSELAKEGTAELTAQQKRAVHAAAASQEVARAPFFERFSMVAFATAAIVVLVVGATILIPSQLRSRQAATGTANVTAAESPAEAQGAQAQFGHRAQPAAPALPVAAVAPAGQVSSDALERRELFKGEAPAASLEQDRLDQLKDQAVPNWRVVVGIGEGHGIAGQVSPPQPMSFTSGVANSFAPAADVVIRPRFNTETYDFISDNSFIRAAEDPLATFSIDVDTASYANVRRFLTSNQLPPKDAVRIEELLNYFTYDYAAPTGPQPIAVYSEVAAAPWEPNHRLVRIAVKGKEADLSKRPPSNLVFLIDVSGSMNDPAKLPLVKSSMKLMIDKLVENDRVAIVVYAGASGLVLPSTSGDKKSILAGAIDRLESGGSTNGAAGIQFAYDTAVANFIKGGINRVILATDGDFNVGISNEGDLTRLIEDKARSGVFLTVLGFGMGNLKDSTLEKLADRGNGNYAYIDSMSEAQKVLVDGLGGTLMTVAKDVKIQVEFNPTAVNAYRLIGYENRVLRNQDFNDDTKDAGDMGAGHSVTALFEVVPAGVELSTPKVDQLTYTETAKPTARAASGEMMNIKIRYKQPDATTSQLLDLNFPVVDRRAAFNAATSDFRFAAAVASFGMILRDSPHKGKSTLDAVLDIAEGSKGADRNGYRTEFVELVRKARILKNQ